MKFVIFEFSVCASLKTDVYGCMCVRWSRGEVVTEDKEDHRDIQKETSSGRRRSRRDREQDLAKKMTTTEVLSDRFESRGELRAVDDKYVTITITITI